MGPGVLETGLALEPGSPDPGTMARPPSYPTGPFCHSLICCVLLTHGGHLWLPVCKMLTTSYRANADVLDFLQHLPAPKSLNLSRGEEKALESGVRLAFRDLWQIP